MRTEQAEQGELAGETHPAALVGCCSLLTGTKIMGSLGVWFYSSNAYRRHSRCACLGNRDLQYWFRTYMCVCLVQAAGQGVVIVHLLSETVSHWQQLLLSAILTPVQRSHLLLCCHWCAVL